MAPGTILTSLTGEAIRAAVPALACLRVRIFRDWPYLYDGALEYEAAYLEKYVSTPGALVVTAADARDGTIVGASTALPLAAAEEELRAPFLAAGHDPADWYYFGESLLDHRWRGRGIGVAFFAAREAEAARLGFARTTFCAVRRPAGHPARPAGHVPLDAFWAKRGYRARPELIATFAWRDVGEAADSPKPMMFWTKERG